MSVKTEWQMLSSKEKWKVALLLSVFLITGLVTSGFEPSWGTCYSEDPAIGGLYQCVWNLFTIAEAVAFVPGYSAEKALDTNPAMFAADPAGAGGLKAELGYYDTCELGFAKVKGPIGETVKVSIQEQGSAMKDLDAKKIGETSEVTFAIAGAKPGLTVFLSTDSGLL